MTRRVAHHPGGLLGRLVYGYASKVPSSRKTERATYDSVAFHFLADNTHPDHEGVRIKTWTGLCRKSKTLSIFDGAKRDLDPLFVVPADVGIDYPNELLNG